MSSSPCYKIVVFGEPGAGKTCFIDQFCYGRSFVAYGLDESTQSHEIVVDGRVATLTLMDLSTSFLKPENGMHPRGWAEGILADADGVVLLYDVTNASSFEYITYQAYEFLWECRRSKGVENGENERESFGCIVVGNKWDLIFSAKKHRQVERALAHEWAQTQGIQSIEVDSLSRYGPECALKLLLKHSWKLEKLGLKKSKAGGQEGERTLYGGQPSSMRNALRDVFRSATT